MTRQGIQPLDAFATPGLAGTATVERAVAGLRRDLTDRRLIYLKAGLFVFAALLAGAGILLESPSLRTGFLLAVAMICACRAYYFAFYVIEHYLDPDYRYAGLCDAATHLLKKGRTRFFGRSAG